MKQLVIPLFIPHYGCMHQCVFCNQRKITGVSTPINASIVHETIVAYLSYASEISYVEVAFYGGTFTALPLDKQEELLIPVQQYIEKGLVSTIRLSTRPDAISEEVLWLLNKYHVSTIELGVQSFSNKVLYSAERGHCRDDIVKSVKLIKDAGFKLGIQLMLGLPGEELRDFIYSTYQTLKLKPDMVRLYPTLVLADTKLASMFIKGLYQPLPLFEAVKRCAFAKTLFEKNNIHVIRTGLQDVAELRDTSIRLAGPYHAAFGELVDAYMYYVGVAQFLESLSTMPQKLVIHHHPKDASKVRGLHKENVVKWKLHYDVEVSFCQDGEKTNMISLDCDEITYTVNKYKLT